MEQLESQPQQGSSLNHPVPQVHKQFKTKIILIAVIVILLVLGTVTAWYLSQRQQSVTDRCALLECEFGCSNGDCLPKPQSSDPTTNWKTYKDSEEFTFKYPQDWDLKSEEPSLSEIYNSSKQYSITVTIDHQSFGEGSFYCQSDGKNTNRCEKISVKDEIIDTTAFIDWDYEGRKSAHVEIAGPWERGAVTFNLTPINEDTKNILRKILSTFKFTDQTQTIDTSNWKTYTNKKYSYSFAYPDGYKIEEYDYGGEVNVNLVNTSDDLDSLISFEGGESDHGCPEDRIEPVTEKTFIIGTESVKISDTCFVNTFDFKTYNQNGKYIKIGFNISNSAEEKLIIDLLKSVKGLATQKSN